MTSEPDIIPPFRDQLLGAQQTTSSLRDEYRRELDAMVNQNLTPRKRLETWFWLIGSILFIAWCTYGLVIHRDKTAPRIILPAFIAIGIVHIIWLIRALRRGSFARRSNFKLMELWTLGAGLVLTVSLFTGMFKPGDPASTFSLLFTFIFYACCAAMSMQNKMDEGLLTMRESMLRLESRLADLADRLPK